MGCFSNVLAGNEPDWFVDGALGAGEFVWGEASKSVPRTACALAILGIKTRAITSTLAQGLSRPPVSLNIPDRLVSQFWHVGVANRLFLRAFITAFREVERNVRVGLGVNRDFFEHGVKGRGCFEPIGLRLEKRSVAHLFARGVVGDGL